MHSIRNETNETVDVTCTWDELAGMEAFDMAMYATPTPDGRAGHWYIARQPQFKYDFIVATVQDFEDKAGYERTGDWLDTDQPEHVSAEYTLTVPRCRQEREA